MTPSQILRKLEATRKAYSALWDHVETLEDDLDEAGERGIGCDLTGWGVSEMRGNLACDITRLDDAIKAFKKANRRKL